MQGRDITVAIGAAVLALLFLGLMGGGMMMWGPGMMYGYGFGWWGVVMMLFWVLILVGGALFLVWLFRQGRGPEVTAGPTRALDILRERYARGEITREQFEQMRQDIEGR